VCTTRALGPELLPALNLDVKSTGNSARNTIEIVFAGMGFVAIGGNFGDAKVQVWTPQGRGVAIRRPIVQMIGKGYSLRPIRKRKTTRIIHLGNKSRLADITAKLETKALAMEGQTA